MEQTMLVNNKNENKIIKNYPFFISLNLFQSKEPTQMVSLAVQKQQKRQKIKNIQSHQNHSYSLSSS